MLLYTRSKLDSDILTVLGEFRGITLSAMCFRNLSLKKNYDIRER